jgi:hypothetical protein
VILWRFIRDAAPRRTESPCRGRRFPLSIALGVVSLACASPVGAVGLPAFDQPSFDAAVALAGPGDVVHLADGDYPPLRIADRDFLGSLVVDASRDARVAGFEVRRSSGIVLRGMTIRAAGGGRAAVLIASSTRVALRGVSFDGVGEDQGAGLVTRPDDSDVTVRGGEFTNCGLGAACIATGASRLRVVENNFHDCLDCDFIRGGGGAEIRSNLFDRAVAGSCDGGALLCHHNDHVQITGGGPWTIVANRFGDRDQGAASVFVSALSGSEPIHDVRVVSNLFKGDAGYFAVLIGPGAQATPLPTRVSIVNNTILSGSSGGVRLAPELATQALPERPLVANNIIAVEGQWECLRARFDSNLVLGGMGCAGDASGDAHLTDEGLPTPSSTLVIDQADPTVAPPRDFLDLPRVGSPDRGAFEFRQSVDAAVGRGSGAAPSP